MRRTTPSPSFNQILTGLYEEARGYAAWRERGTDDWLIIATIRGSGRFGFSGGEALSKPGDLMLLQPNSPHDYGVESEPWLLLWAHFRPRPHWLEWLEWPEVTPGLKRLSLGQSEDAQAAIQRLMDAHRAATGPQRRKEDLAMNALEAFLLLCDEHNPRAGQTRIDERIRQSMETLCFNLGEKIDIELLARQAGLSPSRLAHLFREQVGAPPQQFLETQRLNRARQLLELTSRPIQAIAYELGFENPYYFTRRFKRHTGQSPRAYRRQHGE